MNDQSELIDRLRADAHHPGVAPGTALQAADALAEAGFEDSLRVIHHTAGLDAVYQAGREDGAGDARAEISSDPNWFLAHEDVRAGLEAAWCEGVTNALNRLTNGFDSVVLSDNPYRTTATGQGK